MPNEIVVMIVEDEESILELLEQLFRRLLKDCDVLRAGSKTEAEVHADERSIDVTLIDGLYGDGPLLVKNLVQSGRGGKLVACTSDDKLQAEMMLGGCVASIDKPLNIRKLIELVQQLAASP